MKIKKLLYILFVLCWLLIFLPGCIYLRLLTLKNQLAQFDTYFLLKGNGQLVLTAKSPLLYSSDVIRLVGVGPTNKKQNNEGTLWEYVFQKEYPGPKMEEEDFDITLTMLFQDDKLVELRFPKRMLTILPRYFLVAMFRSLGQAIVDKGNRTVTSHSSERIEGPFQVPSRDDIIRRLGQPFFKQDDKTGCEITYKYRIVTDNTEVDPSKTQMSVRFLFGRDEKLSEVKGNFAWMRIRQSYQIKATDKAGSGEGT